jgi:hypothetical protein
MYTNIVYRGLPTWLMLTLMAFAQFFAIHAFA